MFFGIWQGEVWRNRPSAGLRMAGLDEDDEDAESDTTTDDVDDDDLVTVDTYHSLPHSVEGESDSGDEEVKLVHVCPRY